MKRTLPVVLVMVALSLSPILFAQRQPPLIVQSGPLILDNMTLSEKIASVDAVLVVHVMDVGRPRVVDAIKEFRIENPLVAAAPVVSTMYEALVKVVFKAHPRAGAVNSVITVGHGGGEGEWEGRAVIDTNLIPKITRGLDYIVFLMYEEDWDALMFSADRVFELNNGRLAATRVGTRTKYGAALDRKTLPEATALIEEASR